MRLEFGDFVGLVFRAYTGYHMVHAHLPGDGVRSGLVVAGQHGDGDAVGLQCGDGLRRIRFDGIGHGDDARKFTVDGNEHRRFALCRQTIHIGDDGV